MSSPEPKATLEEVGHALTKPKPPLHAIHPSLSGYSLGKQTVELAQFVGVAFLRLGGVQQGRDAMPVELGLIAATQRHHHVAQHVEPEAAAREELEEEIDFGCCPSESQDSSASYQELDKRRLSGSRFDPRLDL